MSSLDPLSPSKWSRRHARHLLNRAGFGVPEERVDYLAGLTPERAVADLVHYHDIPTYADAPDFLIGREEYRVYRQEIRNASREERDKLSMELRVRERAALAALQAWWFERFVNSPRPLEEKMTLFWHGHFATSAQKVQYSYLNWQLNDIFRQRATGNFKRLTIDVGQSPMMLRYLDNIRNVKEHPNENWARELMELFTMGQGHYTEHEIKEAARAFTGWTSDMGRFAYHERKHDFGTKTFFGRTGNFDGWDIIDIIFEQPVTADFICAKLWRYFAGDDPSRRIVTDLAETLRANDYELQPVLERMFLAEAFYADGVMGNQIKSPVHYLVQLAHDLELDPPPYLAMARQSAQLGQALFAPPNVAGWEGGRAWINANTLLLRYNLPKSLVVADLIEPDDMSMMDMQRMRSGSQKQYRDLFRQAMETLPPSERREVRARLGEMETREARQAVFQEVVLKAGGDNAWDLRGMFDEFEFETVGECVEALAARYLATPLADDQRKVLARALSPSGALSTPLAADTLTHDQMAAAMQLIFSMAEYQLC